jgi:Aldehyde dehydrogenase family
MTAQNDILRARADDVATLMVRENGKPLVQARLETLAGADIIDWFAGEAQRAYGQVIPSRAPDVLQMTLKLPVGPVAAFTPWNFPINQVVRKLSAALAAGCSIIVKAPEETPASPAALIRRLAAGRGEPCVRRACRDFGIPHPASRHPQGQLHRLNPGGQASGGAGRAAHEAGNDGTGRPCPRHHHGGRRP